MTYLCLAWTTRRESTGRHRVTETCFREPERGRGSINDMRVAARSFLVIALALACAPTGEDCGEPTKLEPHPSQPAFTGAPLGPLLVRNFRDGESMAIINEYAPGYATKVVIVAKRPFDKALTLRGRRCSDGTPLRFAWSYPFALNSTPAPSGVFAAAGEEASVIEPLTSLPTSGVIGPAAPPYMLFASSGKWILEVREGSTLVGHAVLLVR